MRPRDLVVSGFRSYESETRLCWDDRSLVGIVGPIGSGKSSILDAIAFALYNQTPRSGSRTTSLINQRRDVAQVALTFEVDGVTYKAVRSLRRAGASAHVLYRIEGGEEVPITDRARDMGETIETLLGLDFSAFQRSVLLAQNQFAEFLEAPPADRNTVLKGVFGFDRLDAMRAVARRRLDALGNRLAVLADRRASAESDRADLETRRAELDRAEERAAALEELRAPFEETKEIIAAAQRRLEASEAVRTRLDGLADRIPDGRQTDDLLTAAAQATSRVSDAEAALRVATEVRTAAQQDLDDLLEGVGGRAGLDRAGDLVAEWRSAVDRHEAAMADHARAERKLAELKEASTASIAALEAAQSAADLAAAAETSAGQTVEKAAAAVEAVRQAHRAHAVRADLVLGEPCPVCTQTVTEIPDDRAPDSIEAAQAGLVEARERHSAAVSTARETSDELATTRASADSLSAAIVEAEDAAVAAVGVRDRTLAEVESTASAVAEALGEGVPSQVLDAIRSRVAEAQQKTDDATSSESVARGEVEAARTAARSAESALGDLRAALASLSGSLQVDVAIGDDSESLGAALHTLRTEWLEQRAAAEEEVRSGEEAVRAGRAALTELLEAAGLGVGDDLAEVVNAAVTERSAKEAEVALLEKRLADLDALAADESDLVTSAARLERIHVDLTPSRFLAHVLDERRRALGDLASEHFETLSAGRYRFDDSGDLDVVDLTAADAVRSPASLSGGETFLASLALALALAEMVSREGGRLDAFFLDEGFGSLDPEHLDLAMTGVERLVTSGSDRLVVVVSHVPALTERIEDLIELDRDPITGDTRLVSGSGCR